MPRTGRPRKASDRIQGYQHLPAQQQAGLPELLVALEQHRKGLDRLKKAA
jgi:hypothetical protein